MIILKTAKTVKKNMTITEAVLDLLKYFTSKDSFSFSANFKELVTIEGLDKDEDQRKSIYLSALDYLVEQNILRKSQISKTPYWTLIDKLASSHSKIQISHETGVAIATLLKGLEVSHNVTIDCNPMRIEEKDIHMLIAILNNVLNSPKNNE